MHACCVKRSVSCFVSDQSSHKIETVSIGLKVDEALVPSHPPHPPRGRPQQSLLRYPGDTYRHGWIRRGEGHQFVAAGALRTETDERKRKVFAHEWSHLDR